MDKIITRMKIGKERYGHGIRINDDTKEWGTKNNSWTEMAEEEILDALIYVAAQKLRENINYKADLIDDNEKIKEMLENSDHILIKKLWEIHEMLS